jgi:cytochrome c
VPEKHNSNTDKGQIMSDLFFNKIAAAGLAAALGFIGINKIANIVVHADIPSTPAYSVYVADASDVVVEVEAPFPQAEWIEGIDAVKGAKVFKKCTSCHNANDGGKNGTGPALWNVVGRTAGAGADFNYSPAMSGSGITWNYEELDGYLANPKTYLPKNKMAFIGVKKASDRAAVIEYLRLASNTPIAALTEAAPIPGAEDAGGHVDEAHVEDAAVEMIEDAVEETVVETDTVPAIETPSTEIVEETVVDSAEEIVETVEDTAGDVMEKAEDVAEDLIEKVEDAAEDVVDAVETPKDDGGQ